MLLNIFQFSSLPPVRVVFEVTMEGSARKVITVRSALIVKNKLETPMELRLDSPSAPDSKRCIFLPYYGQSLASSPRRFTTVSNGCNKVVLPGVKMGNVKMKMISKVS